MTTYREAYIRVAIVSECNGMVKCLPVNEQHEAFDGVEFMPCYIKVDQSAIVPSPMPRDVEPIQLYYGGKKFNRIEQKKVTT